MGVLSPDIALTDNARTKAGASEAAGQPRVYPLPPVGEISQLHIRRESMVSANLEDCRQRAFALPKIVITPPSEDGGYEHDNLEDGARIWREKYEVENGQVVSLSTKLRRVLDVAGEFTYLLPAEELFGSDGVEGLINEEMRKLSYDYACSKTNEVYNHRLANYYKGRMEAQESEVARLEVLLRGSPIGATEDG